LPIRRDARRLNWIAFSAAAPPKLPGARHQARFPCWLQPITVPRFNLEKVELPTRNCLCLCCKSLGVTNENSETLTRVAHAVPRKNDTDLRNRGMELPKLQLAKNQAARDRLPRRTRFGRVLRYRDCGGRRIVAELWRGNRVIFPNGMPRPVQIETTVFSWFKPDRQREEIREDRKRLEARARRLLKNYLSADELRKQQYYEVLAGAAAACQPDVSDPKFENPQLAQTSAEAALKVVKLRERQAIDDNDQLAALITDAYATVALAYRRASAAYTVDEDMQKLGTAAVHLLTIAMSYMAAQSEEVAHK
jgi:hypothetical protein